MKKLNKQEQIIQKNILFLSEIHKKLKQVKEIYQINGSKILLRLIFLNRLHLLQLLNTLIQGLPLKLKPSFTSKQTKINLSTWESLNNILSKLSDTTNKTFFYKNFMKFF
ncbi:hypothetical protein TTHERM_000609358 (macronuclear) [Tetrahymena thermophila SB210]|uniref:Uncharacterized protein n=1 Tax=Tetrahymena thermophila (strain SB210) TaxID=312017 RepID=W7XL80_TETTS|nr:hypothetical protein TTHERM_000609358 [Tetrahymena thermophila SB210]EWS75824.1 hypothetical protein TTHERM_000609358 [Tetrahymena thermophila SB210]|eukprot:XP_012651638.1 hypothetical protein TTHERM_000609358 [Tetrahymena thermophila SB210]